MISEQLVDKIMEKVLVHLNQQPLKDENTITRLSAQKFTTPDQSLLSAQKQWSELVGIAAGNSVGVIISQISSHLLPFISVDNCYKSIGIVSSVNYISGHLMAVDQVLNRSNCVLLNFSQPEEKASLTGRSALTVLASDSLAELKITIEQILTDITYRSKTGYYFDSGYVEWQYCGIAGEILQKQFQIQPRTACAIINVAPAAMAFILFNKLVDFTPVTVNHCDLPLTHHHSINSGQLVISGGMNEIRSAIDYIETQGKQMSISLLSKIE